MKLRMLRRGVCVGMTVALSAACASHAPPRGAPEVSAAPRDSLETYMSKVRKLSIAAKPNRVPLATVEEGNDELREALRLLDLGATPERHRRVAEAYRQVGVLDLAYDHFASARQLDNRDAAAYDGLARIWRDWGFPDLGLGDASRALYYAPTSAAAHNTFGTLLYALGRTADARRAFQRAVALNRFAEYAWTNLCYSDFEAGNLNAAASQCRKALTIEPGFAPAHHNLGLVYAAAGRMKLAEAEFVAANTDRAVREYNLGIVWAGAGKYAEAVRAFETAESFRPGWTRAAERARQARRLAEQATAGERQ